MSRLAEPREPTHRWDVLVLLTDLPRRVGTRPTMSDYSSAWFRAGLVAGAGRGRPASAGASPVRFTCCAICWSTGWTWTSPVGWGEPLRSAEHIDAEDAHTDQHLALAGVRGRLRLLAGMVRDNRPWRLVPHLSSATAAAAAVAYGVWSRRASGPWPRRFPRGGGR
jgi:hypothetical protein